MVLGLPRPSLCVVLLACVAADSFPFSGGAEIEQANEKQVREAGRRKIKPFLLENDPEKNSRAVLVNSLARLNHAQNRSW